jgi:hypothetical protein
MKFPIAINPAARTTAMLVLGIVVSSCLLLFAGWQFSTRADQAQRSVDDWQVCQRDFAELESLRARRTLSAPLASSDSELNRRLNASAVSAGISKDLASIEPATPMRVHDTDYTQTAVYLQLNAVSMKQLVTFLDTLSAADAAVQAKTIELTPAPSTDAAERWSSAVALEYLTYAPRGRENGR